MAKAKGSVRDAMVAPIARADVVRDLVEKHGIAESLLPKVSQDVLKPQDENSRLLRQQRDTLAYQWATEFAKMEQTSRTCLWCDFVAKSRVSLRAHMRRHVSQMQASTRCTCAQTQPMVPAGAVVAELD